MKDCEQCGKEHDGKFGSGKFCSRGCANKRSITGEKCRKTSETLKRKYANGEIKVWNKGICSPNTAVYKRNIEEVKSILDMSKRTTEKVLRRLKLPCSYCNWYIEGVVCDVYHIIPKSKGGSDLNNNLTYICPNCHRLASVGLINKFVTLEQQIGDEWKKYVFYKIENSNKIFEKKTT